MRTEIKLGRNRISELEVALGLNRKNGDVAKQLLAQVVKTRPNPIMESDFEQAIQALSAQKDLIGMLKHKLDSFDEPTVLDTTSLDDKINKDLQQENMESSFNQIKFISKQTTESIGELPPI